MPRTEKPSQTELAQRLRQIRCAAGFKERKQFANYLGIPVSTLASYERGLSEPTISALAVYKNIGVSIDWIATGEGDLFDDRTEKPAPLNIEYKEKDYLQKAVKAVETGLAGTHIPHTKKAELIDLARALFKEGKTEHLRKIIALLLLK